MTDHPIRFFEAEAEIVRLGDGLVACTLVREDWTHEAHLAACLYLLTRRPDVDVDRDIAGLISRFNESVGGVNDDNGGYHDTITCAYVAGTRWFLKNPPRNGEGGVAASSDVPGAHRSSGAGLRSKPWPKDGGGGQRQAIRFAEGPLRQRCALPPPRSGEDLVDLVNALLASEVGSRDWPLRFYSRDLLFSVAARRGFVPPDLAPLPAA